MLVSVTGLVLELFGSLSVYHHQIYMYTRDVIDIMKLIIYHKFYIDIRIEIAQKILIFSRAEI